MRIAGWHIDGFGVFHDIQVRDVPPGLTVFLGPNEAGKTTLLAFIRQMLFGFPSDTVRERAYPPLRGGRHGGRLVLIGPDGEYVVERSEALGPGALVTLPGGGHGDESDLARLLGGADHRLFQTVFAFSLAELQDFATLDAEGMHDRIFSAGITGAGRSTRAAVSQLHARQEALLGPHGDGRINELRARVDEVERRLRQARLVAAGYGEALRYEAACAAEVERLGREIENHRAAQARYRKLEELWPIWYRRRDAAGERERLEPVGTMPERAEARLSELRAAIDAVERQVAEIAAEVDAAEARRQMLAPDDALEAVSEEVVQLYETLPLYRDRLVAVPEVTARLRRAQQALHDHLRDLGAGWDRTRLAGFDRSLPKREEVRAFAEQIEQAEAAVMRAQAVARHAAEQREQAAAALETLRRELEAAPPAPEAAEVERLEAAVRRVRNAVAERASVQARIQAATETLQQVASLRQRAEPSSTAMSPNRVRLGLWGLALALGGLAALVSDSDVSPLLALAAVLAAVGALIAGRRASEPVTLDGTVKETFSEQQQRIQGDLDAYQARLRSIDAAIEADAALLELSTPPDEAAVEAAAERVARMRAAYDERLRRLLDIEAAETRLHDAESASERAEAAVRDAEGERDRAQGVWDEWKRREGVPADLTPRGVLDFFEAIRQGREALRELEAAEREARQLSQFVVAFERRAGEALSAVGLPTDARGLKLATAIEKLRERVERDRELRRELATIEETLGRLHARLAAAQRERDGLRERWAALLAEVGAADEADFYRRLDIARRREELAAVVRECDQRIAEQIGDGPAAARMREELATGAVDRWRRAAEDAGRAMLAATEARDRAIAARREAELARRQLEESTEIADLELERAGLLQEYAEAVRAWRVAGLAAGLIEETLARYERERQPAVLAHASRLFHDITGGQYTQLLQRDRHLVVLDRDGRARALDTLSRGTAEQLYLCIRLGLATEFARRAAALPLVMDDILVNFDPERARVVAEALATVAEQHQVLLFTCHPETAELIREVAPTSGQYLMTRYGGEIRPVPSGLTAG